MAWGENVAQSIMANDGSSQLASAIEGGANLINASQANLQNALNGISGLTAALGGFSQYAEKTIQNNAREKQDKADRIALNEELDAQAKAFTPTQQNKQPATTQQQTNGNQIIAELFSNIQFDSKGQLQASLAKSNEDDINNESVQLTGLNREDLSNVVKQEFYKSGLSTFMTYEMFTKSLTSQAMRDSFASNKYTGILYDNFIKNNPATIQAMQLSAELDEKKARFDRGEFTFEEAYNKADRLKQENEWAYRKTTTSDLAKSIFEGGYKLKQGESVEEFLNRREEADFTRLTRDMFKDTNGNILPNGGNTQQTPNPNPNGGNTPTIQQGNTSSKGTAQANTQTTNVENAQVENTAQDNTEWVDDGKSALVNEDGNYINEQAKQLHKDAIRKDLNTKRELNKEFENIGQSTKEWFSSDPVSGPFFSKVTGLEKQSENQNKSDRYQRNYSLTRIAVPLQEHKSINKIRDIGKNLDTAVDIYLTINDQVKDENGNYTDTSKQQTRQFYDKLDDINIPQAISILEKVENFTKYPKAKDMATKNINILKHFQTLKENKKQLDRGNTETADIQAIAKKANPKTLDEVKTNLEKEKANIFKKVKEKKGDQTEAQTLFASKQQEAVYDYNTANASMVGFSEADYNPNSGQVTNKAALDNPKAKSLARLSGRTTITLSNADLKPVTYQVKKADTADMAWAYLVFSGIVDENTNEGQRFLTDLANGGNEQKTDEQKEIWNLFNELSKNNPAKGLTDSQMADRIKKIITTIGDIMGKYTVQTKPGFSVDKVKTLSFATGEWKTLRDMLGGKIANMSMEEANEEILRVLNRIRQVND